ncbi:MULTISPECIES: DUF2127 domain-containing protein [unclassified Vibrio]|uniref:DUF2127 domain-containing protein n=1 Tax=Vibrio sp. HB236076 TaxID=3232307 RepID=A0AB39HC26_9VIBR|nr:DUF2127 domain-containing protein [Vibrio sp. HB161653]MDP5253569.1 DUF2127 domain-containing protein [Vibrio sp. HB161653]
MNKYDNGLRVIAVTEAMKGTVAAFTCWLLLHLGYQQFHQQMKVMIDVVHLFSARDITALLKAQVDKITPNNYRTVISILALYASMRFIEAGGLWYSMRWTQWFAIVSGAIYLPFEVFDWIKQPSWWMTLVIVFNSAVVIYVYFTTQRQAKMRLDEELTGRYR